MWKVRKTSAEAYQRINAEGMIRGFQLDVYNIVYKHGPLTAGQVWSYYKKLYPETHRGRNECAKRISELTKMTVLEDTGMAVLCPVTKFNAILWDVTKNLPVKKTKAERHDCPTCNGKGYLMDSYKQSNFRFI